MQTSILKWERDFTKTVLRLAMPIAVQALVMALMHILDNVMIGQLGEIELAGVTQANRVSFLLQVIMFGLVSGSSIFSAQYWGKRDVEGIRGMMSLTLGTSIALALLFVLPCLIAPGRLMALLIKDQAAAQCGAQYLRVVAFVYLMDALLMVHEAVLKSTEHVNLPTISGIVAILTNTLFNYLLIFGRFGFPRLGIRGGALATLIGVSLQLVITLSVSYRRGYANAISPRALKLPPKGVILRYFRTVAPVMLNETLWSLGMVLCSVAYGRMSAGAVAAMSIFSNVEQLSFVLMRGITSACAILVGKDIGAGLADQAQRDAKRFLLYNVLLSIVMGALVLVIAGFIVERFNISADTAASARRIISWYACLIWLQAGNSTLIVGILRSGGDVVYSAVLDTVFLWLISVPLAFVCGPVLGWPIQYVYLTSMLEQVLKFALGIRRLRSGKWINNLVEDG